MKNCLCDGHSQNFCRAKNMVLGDSTSLDCDAFCRDVKVFLSRYFVFSGASVEVVRGSRCKLVICVNVTDVSKSRRLPS